jgi:Ca-activated chloride channel family protein
MRSRTGLVAAVTAMVSTAIVSSLSAQQTFQLSSAAPVDPPAVSFRSAVSLVSVSAVVRDRRGKVMPSLKQSDFEVIDGGQRRQVIDFHSDANAPASVALLIDGSGSMRLSAKHMIARSISRDLLASLDARRDSAALMSFDTRLLTLCEFTRDFDRIQQELYEVQTFGSTSVYDAVAGAAARVADRTQNRRAVIVLTDGTDNASLFSPEKVSWIASTIDVPVYVFAIGDRDMTSDDEEHRTKASVLAEIARATGGDLFIADTPALVAAGVKRVTEELRHQYVIAFESSTEAGLRRVEIRTRKPELRVTSRNWYQAEAE